MRLTLRTLLAYLDDTLEPQDADILRQKVEQSGFATQLVQRIRDSLSDGTLSAPAPDSVHPIEEPNMMSNYLDSALSPEQIAEIEKACLESMPHLAEAAACHQILTMVLGKPAEVSDELRERIFAMVDLRGNVVNSERGTDFSAQTASMPSPIAGEIGPRFSGVDLSGDDDLTCVPLPEGVEQISDQPLADLPATSAVAETEPFVQSDELSPHEIKPVGVNDSGVFQAATKLREQSQQFAETGTALDDSGPLAGVRPLKELERSDYFQGEVRTSRITPWIVSLALVATLLFAIVKIFAPLMGPKVAEQVDQPKVSEQYPEIPVEDLENADSPAGTPIADDTAATEDTSGPPEMLPAPESSERIDEPVSASELTEPAPIDAPESPQDGATNDGDSTASEMESDANSVDQPSGGDSASEVTVTDEAPPIPIGMPDERIASLPTKDTPDAAPTKMDPSTVDPGPDAAVEKAAIAKLASKNALVAMRSGDSDWKLMATDATLNSGDEIVCGPEYRSELSILESDKVTVEQVGPSGMRFNAGTETVNLTAEFGRGLIRLADPGQSIAITVADDEHGAMTLVATTESTEAILAYDLTYLRELGADPLVPENHDASLELTAVAGEFAISVDDAETNLSTGSQVTFELAQVGKQDTEVATPPQLPTWIDPEIDNGSLDAEAATDLIELVRSDGSDSLLLSLRVALSFRRNEVAALAGKTMLSLGDASAYFGVDGLLTNPKQRLYWSSHLDMLRMTISRGANESAAVRKAIAGQNEAMDNADGDTLFRLLTGYSQDQLKTGGDAELVNDLESGSIPVRVLASEHLRDISGTTLFFKPEEEVASRREEVVKKWKVRLRKEAIRYPETE